jgi:CBS domain-containing protein
VSHFFLKSFSTRYIHSAHFALQNTKRSQRDENSLFLFSQDVAGVVKGKLHTCLPTDTVKDAAAKMARYGIGSLLVKTDDGTVLGILTDKDLRNKLVAKGLSSLEPVQSIMSSPIKTTSSEAVCFDALFSMLKNRIHHLAVQKDGDIIGMITAHDIMLLQGASPLFLFKEISAQREIQGLYQIPRQFPGVVSRLIDEGAKASNINRMITVLNDQILDRLLTILIQDLGTPPVPFCWMVMGSEGRKEQTFKTDQDNAIIYEDVKPRDREWIHAYFMTLAEEAVHHLAACGYALCKGNIMASNPDWTQSLTDWKKTFDHWIFSPDPKEVLHSTIFFDFRPAFGNADLAYSLREHLLGRTLAEKVFIHHLARDCQSARSPLSLLKKISVEKGGAHRGHIDLKTKGLTPFVDFARLMSLDNGLPATNTLERIQSLQDQAAISDEFAKKITESYEYQMQIRLIHQMGQIEKGESPDNYINPSVLSDIEYNTLKRAFKVIDEMQSFIENRFHLNLG